MYSPDGGRAKTTPSSCRCNKAMLTEGPSSLTARLCLESSLSISSSPNSTRERWDATGLDGRVAAWERAGERSGELKALPISEAVSVLSLLGVGEGCEADVMQMPPVRPSVRTERGVFRASFLWASFFSFSANTVRAIWLSTPVATRPVRDRRLAFRSNLKRQPFQTKLVTWKSFSLLKSGKNNFNLLDVTAEAVTSSSSSS